MIRLGRYPPIAATTPGLPLRVNSFYLPFAVSPFPITNVFRLIFPLEGFIRNINNSFVW